MQVNYLVVSTKLAGDASSGIIFIHFLNSTSYVYLVLHVTKIYTHNLSVPKFFLSLAYLAYETFGAERLRVQILIT